MPSPGIGLVLRETQRHRMVLLMGTLLFLSLRGLHVLLAAVWVGSMAFTSYLLMPVIQGLGPVGGHVMIGLNSKGMTRFIALISGMTVLTGIYLFWHFTGGFDPEISRSHAGRAFGIGGFAGLIAAIVSRAIVGRSAEKVARIMEQASMVPDGPQKGELMQTATILRQRVATFSTVVLAFQVIALILMAIGHYV